ncbi:MAG: hypothetical protein NZ901_01245 [Geminocystis sp.]|nr:hypothetical protein [Geminocystis sp.]MCS7146793.1 hypothetical protein [Geminocystis sp.]MDW8115619.1 hypothetical protein [Geminocystis sp.]MDW8463161.1 hypothetical protein [Geminocystis sp.]HIK36713.1 hypothetical protein [Geminocystis sp. M7585_C2015_104]
MDEIEKKKEVFVMKIMKMLEAITRYLTEGFARIFSPPEENSPPEIGVQPFDCAPYREKSSAHS